MNKKRSLMISTLLLMLLTIVSTLNAQDNTLELDDNACYAGGVLEGECFSEQDWICGWHIANLEEAVEAGEPYALPAECSYVAPAVPAQPGTSQENACFEGGAMEGKCDTDWEWECGWYLARWQEAGGWNGDYDMPSWCESVLPGQNNVQGETATLCISQYDHVPPFMRCLEGGMGYDDFNMNGTKDYIYMFGDFSSCPSAPSGFSFYSGPNDMYMEVEPGLILPVADFAFDPWNVVGPQQCAYVNNNLAP